MGNLGLYQEIVEAAKKSGGVEAFLKNVERSAIAKAAPSLMRAGADQAAPALMRAGALRAAPAIVGFTLLAGGALLVGAVEVDSRIKQARDHRKTARNDAHPMDENRRLRSEHSSDQPDQDGSTELPIDQGPGSGDDADAQDDSPTTNPEGNDDADRS